jgi:hypothetical protein
MNFRRFRAVATACFIGTAALAAVTVATCQVAEAAAVRAVVGKPLEDAKALAAAGKYDAAMEKVRQAEAVPNKTAAESQIVQQMKEYISVKSGDTSTALGCRAKFAADYNGRRYSSVIEDAACLRKFGALDGQSMTVIAQAYYLSGNKEGCLKYIKDNIGGGAAEATLELEMRCAFDAGDEDTQRQVLEQLVARTGKAEYWGQLLTTSERAKGLNDHATLDLYRLKLLTGSMKGGDDYTLLAKLALSQTFAAEAQSVIEKGLASKALASDTSAPRLLNMAKAQAVTNAASLPRAEAAANAAKAGAGDGLVKIGEDQWGAGKAQDAVKTIEAGIAKGVADSDNAQIRLGMAYLAAGQRADALKAFAAVKSDPKWVMIAHLWSLYAKGARA